MKVTLAQINFWPRDVKGHLRRIKDIISAHSSSELIVFPELILHGHPSDLKPEGYLYRQVKARMTQAAQGIYRHAKQCGARVVLGQLQREGDLYLNLATYIGRRRVQSYAKTHVHWTENFRPGNQLKVFDTALGPLGLNICYDSAFSEVWRTLALNGARMVVNISAVPAHFPVAQMRRRMQGAAIFNQYHVIYVNRPGPHFSGGSAVYDPMGEEIAALGGGEEVRQVELNPSAVDAWRQEEIIFPNRRPHLYRRIANRNKEIERVQPPSRLRVVSG